MSIEIYKVNNLFTIERVSVYVFVWVDVYRWMECLGRDVNRMQCGMGCVGWLVRLGNVGWGEDVKFGWVGLG